MNNPIDQGPIHSLYVGSRDGTAFSEIDRQSVTDTVTSMFDSFTAFDAEGCFQGKHVATIIIKIATDNGRKIDELARHLGRDLNQQYVGLEKEGHYRSIPMD